MNGICYYCGIDGLSVRPLGPNNSLACYPCVTATPGRVDVARSVFANVRPKHRGPRTRTDLLPRRASGRHVRKVVA